MFVIAGGIRGSRNADQDVVEGFGYEWKRFDQSTLSPEERARRFAEYFSLVDWSALPPNAVAVDVGCGSGRWAVEVAPRVGTLHCIDPAPDALAVAEANLTHAPNCQFHLADVGNLPLEQGSVDFVYSLGVLHHVPDTAAAIRACAQLLKPGAPLLLYLYYDFENRPAWYRWLWRTSNVVRLVLSRSPTWMRALVADVVAAGVYWPLARAALFAERIGIDPSGWPLAFYRTMAFSTMRVDALDRFGTRLEQRFSRAAIERMMRDAGLSDIRFSDHPPYWVAMGVRR